MPDWLRQRARLSPDRPALVCGERWTFAELDREVGAAAARLAAAGVRSGGRVALLAWNSAGFAQVVHAIARLGAVLVPLNARLAEPELRWQVEDVEAAALIYDEANTDRATALREACLATRAVGMGEVVGGGNEGVSLEAAPEPRFRLSAVHSIVYTSGTSGSPKGAMLTYGNHLWSATGSVLNLGLRSDDRWLACLPLFHVGGLAILLRSVIYGIPAVVHESFEPIVVNRAIDEDGVTIVSVVGAMLQRILDVRGDRPYPPTLRCVLVGGGPVPRSLLEECAQRGMPVVQTYGLTEAASQVATLAPDDAPRKLGSAGKPLFATKVRVQGDDSGVLPAGVPGEIAVRGPTVMAGYYHRPEETARVLRNGWLHTGDVGYLDDEGYLYVLDRRADLIISGGENVYPAQVEAVLAAHPAVEEAGVTGLPDEQWGQTVAALVKLRRGARASEEELRAFCRERLAGYKVPVAVRFVDELPRNAQGKLVRRALREGLL
ncbi:MAG: o-succinylbenzoate--CoA ligase [Chloroflexi bacterium]|nr:o-succinylbenzoate--CoA ligase [Chloroflexota bacterium]